jgi:hypothetical protein
VSGFGREIEEGFSLRTLRPKDGLHHAIAIASDGLTAVRVVRKSSRIEVRDIYRVPLDPRLDEVRWRDALEEAVAAMPSCFHRFPCTVLLPHLEPLAKWIEMPAVERHLLRETVAEAMEVDLPVQERDFAWEFVGAQEKEGKLGGYIFAERRAKLLPIFDLLASECVYPDGALLPLMADFSEMDRKVESGSVELQLCIGENCTSIGFVGGNRPYLRYLSYGWNRLLGGTGPDGLGETGSEFYGSVRSWLLEKKLPAEEKKEVEDRLGAFLDQLAQEVTQTELQYVHNFAGKHAGTVRLLSAMVRSERLEKMLGERLKGEVLPLDRSVLSLPVFAKKASECVDDLTWMRLIWACGGPMHSSADRSPFLPEYVEGKRFRELALRKTVTVLATLAVVLGLGLVWQRFNALFLTYEIKSTAGQRDREKDLYGKLHETDLLLEDLKNCFLSVDMIRQRQEDWLRLFSELETALYNVKDAWLTGFRVVSVRETIMEREPSVVHISGYLLIRVTHDGTAAGQVDRMNALVRNLKNCDSVLELSDILFPPQQGQLQPFQCRLTLNHGRF